MRILFVSLPPLQHVFGGAKPFVELAPEFERLGWKTDLVSLEEQVPGDASRMRRARAGYLRTLLISGGAGYDVVDFDHEYLPFARREFPQDTLLAARSVLLSHQVATTTFPRPRTARQAVGTLLRGRERRADIAEMLSFASRSVDQADLVNVSNHDDAELLVRSGVPRDRVVVFPFGLSRVRASRFAAMSPSRPHHSVVAFVGTFDWRKGAADMPAIVERVVREAPGTRFRLLGTKGMFPTGGDVLRRFPPRLRSHLEVVPTFDAERLPGLLEDCALGLFPSYLEGFPFAVLEMLAASLPVVAYDVPGPRMMLHDGFLVPPGNTDAMATRILSLLRDPSDLREKRVEARRCAQKFGWDDIAVKTAAVYAERLEQLRSTSSSAVAP